MGLGGSGVAVGLGVAVGTGSGVPVCGGVVCGIRRQAKALNSNRLNGINSQVFRFISLLRDIWIYRIEWRIACRAEFLNSAIHILHQYVMHGQSDIMTYG